jgi:urease subunit beta
MTAGVPEEPVIPGQLRLGVEPVVLFHDADLVELWVINRGDRAVQVGSHYHFAQVNPALYFDRRAAAGRRLAIPAGTSVRFEPGVERKVRLVPLRGRSRVPGLRGDLAGGTHTPVPEGGGVGV